MSAIHNKIEKILEEFADQEINLGSESARKLVAGRIVNECLSRGKSLLIKELEDLKPALRCT